MDIASSSLQKNKHSLATVIRFFKIVLRKSLEDGYLKIPNKFSKKYGDDMPNPVHLKPPDGTQWKIDWTNHDGEILFEKGWKEFAKFYSLDNGHLLWFEYDGTSNIKVHILDMSGLEIDYPSSDRIRDDDSVEILDEPPERGRGWPRKKVKAEPKQSCPSKSKVSKSAIETEEVERNLNKQELKQHVKNEEDSQSEETAEFKLPMVHFAKPDRDVVREARKFKSKNPSFIIKIKQIHQTGSPASFPVSFFRSHFENTKQLASLSVGKKQWPVTLIHYPCSKRALISCLRLFIRENNLKAGDVCVFELINREYPELKVHIRRSHEIANFRSS
ncbi:hypothetical protein PIB30_070506 [Stylosanthes scabra]|uniref:TF-B3 domain-containing protein n=1 Tax=Stylosanthes scabra TaxID=79078 RepID=A0ABU6WRB4_9FABA|nr:hypothetical protein [Stylosanthes scabra]